MGVRDYERLEIVEFGSQLLTTQDLDPVYVALTGVMRKDFWTLDQVKRWLVAYWCIYHSGLACYISVAEGDEYWDRLYEAAENKTKPPVGDRWPRTPPRRHFRGKAATESVAMLRTRYDWPEQMVDYIVGENVAGNPRTFKAVTDRVQEHSAFGPWIGFKIADMIERVLGKPVDFDDAAVFMFKDPVKAVLKLWRHHTGYGERAKPKDMKQVITQTVVWLTDAFKDFKAPPLFDRPPGLQEIETILCKWSHHHTGFYPLMADTIQITNKELGPWMKLTKACEQYASCMPGQKFAFVK
jgi:hypothetical protein